MVMAGEREAGIDAEISEHQRIVFLRQLHASTRAQVYGCSTVMLGEDSIWQSRVAIWLSGMQSAKSLRQTCLYSAGHWGFV